MSNEEIAVQIQAGDRDLRLELWEQVRRYAWKQVRRWMFALDGRGGVTEEDLIQSGFLALLDAIDTFDPTCGGSFLSWFGFYLKTAFQEATGLRTERQRREPLSNSVSLETPLTGDLEGLTIGDTVPDPSAANAIDDVAERDRQERLRCALKAALELLTAEQRAAVVGRYCYGHKVDRKACAAGMRALRNPDVSKSLRHFKDSA